MSNYVKTTSFGPKDALPQGNPSKVIKGTEFDTEFDNIATAVATKADLASPAFTGTPTAPTAAASTNTTQLATTAFIRQQLYAGSDIASAATITPPADGRSFLVTGTTTITTISSANSYTGRMLWLRFAGALTLTHSASLVLPGASNITTAAGDYGLFRCTGTDTWECVYWSKRAVGDGSGLTNLNASNLASGTVPTARLGGGTASAGTFLRGDNAWSNTISGNYLRVSQNTSSGILISTPNQATNEKEWLWITGGSAIALRAYDDALSGSKIAIECTRTGIDVTLTRLRSTQTIDLLREGANSTIITLSSGSGERVRLVAGDGDRAFYISHDGGSTYEYFTQDANAHYLYSTDAKSFRFGTNSSTRFEIPSTFAQSTFYGGAYTAPVSVSYAAALTINAAQSNVIYVGTLTGNVTSMTISNPVDGQTINVRFVQDATGGRTVALPSGAVVSGSINTAANAVTWLVMTYVSGSSRWEGTWTRIS